MRIFSVTAVMLTYIGVVLLAACGGGASHVPDPNASNAVGKTSTTSTTSTTGASGAQDRSQDRAQARLQLAARAAAAQDRHLAATYRLLSGDRSARTVSVVLATDGTWRVDVARGALGGTADISVTRTGDGLYQCALPSAGQPAAGCVRVAGPNGRLTARHDPRVQHVFTDWLAVLTDKKAPLAVSPALAPDGVRGACYSVESSSVSLPAPLDLGVYCFDQDGTVTGAVLAFGTLVLDGTPGPAPSSVSLPGPVVDGNPLPTASPPRRPDDP